MSDSDRSGERGHRASVDRASGEVHGAGSGAGGRDPREDYDSDPAAGGGEARPTSPAAGDRAVEADLGKSRHPLPRSGEARHNEIPESDEREKGEGEDAKDVVQPNTIAVDPEGRAYPPYDLAR